MKKGFTLVELLVAIACASIVLTTVISSFFFITKMNQTVISNSSNAYKLGVLKDYILLHKEEEIIYSCRDGDVLANDSVLFENTRISQIDFYEDSQWKYCSIKYSEDEEYSFILQRIGE